MSNQHGPAERKRLAFLAQDVGDEHVAQQAKVNVETVADWRREFGMPRRHPSRLPGVGGLKLRDLTDRIAVHEGRTAYTRDVCWYWACECGETKYCFSEEEAEADALTHQCRTEEDWEIDAAAHYRFAAQYGPDVHYDSDYIDSDYFDLDHEPLGVGDGHDHDHG